MSEVCIIGGGAAGCVLALRLARRGIRVTVLESGPRYTSDERVSLLLSGNERKPSGLAGPRRVSAIPYPNPFRLKERSAEIFRNDGAVDLPVHFETVRAVGGTTLFWLGNCPRMVKPDFRMRSTFGVGDDWPVGYDDLEPYYSQAEAEIGIAGEDDNPFAEHRSAPYPMPPIPFSYADEVLMRTSDAMGIEFHHTPQARNSIDYGGRPQCSSCFHCFMCPIDARATFDLTHAAPAESTGLARFVTDATVLRLELDRSGRVRRAVYTGHDRVEQAHEADLFVVAGGGLQTARLLLLSRCPEFPDGLANRSGEVGKNLMNHPVVQVSARIDEAVYPYRVGFESTESFQHYATDTRDEIAAFLMNMNNDGGTGPTPAEIADTSFLWGDALAERVRRDFGHMVSISAGVEQLPIARNRVTLDSTRTDYFGQPGLLVTYEFDDYTRAGMAKAAEVETAIMEAAGADEITEPQLWWPGHHLGTARMGTDPETSVVDPDLRCHDIPNLFIAPPSVYVTSGAANPTLTIAALALRLGDYLGDGA
jgi:choline dehydrogenase-like flavoprotein